MKEFDIRSDQSPKTHISAILCYFLSFYHLATTSINTSKLSICCELIRETRGGNERKEK